MREADISAIEFSTVSAAEPWGDVNILSKAIIVVFALLKAGFNNMKFSPGSSDLITSYCKANKPYLIDLLFAKRWNQDLSKKSSATFRFVTPSRTPSIRILCSFSAGMGWLPSTIDVQPAPTYPTKIRWADLLWFRTSFSRLFRRRKQSEKTCSVTNTELCLILTQAIYICNIIAPI